MITATCLRIMCHVIAGVKSRKNEHSFCSALVGKDSDLVLLKVSLLYLL